MNQIRRSKKKTKKVAKTNSAKTPEQKLQQALEKLQRFNTKNQKLETDLLALKDRVAPIIQSAEEECIRANLDLAIKLASYFDKKTLAEYYREELFGWILQIREDILLNPYNSIANFQALDKAMEEAISTLHQHQDDKLEKKLRKQGCSDEEIQEVFNQKEEQDPTEEEIKQFFEDILSESLDDESEEENVIHDDLFGCEDEIPHDYDDDFFNFEDEIAKQFREEALAEKQIENLINGKAIKTLFRRIAKALHPDLAQNPEEKLERHHKMADLLKARDEKDLAAIFKHYTETVGEIPANIFGDNIHLTTKTIERQIDDLRDTYFILERDNPELLFFYDMFYAQTPSQERKKIESYRQNINEKTTSLIGLKKEIRNLNVLKQCLDERYRLHQLHEHEYWE